MQSLSVNNRVNTSFKGDSSKAPVKKLPAARKPYETHTGLITKGTLAGIGVLTSLMGKDFNAKNTAISAIAGLGIGCAIDMINNKKRREFAEDTAGKDVVTIAKEQDGAVLTNDGNPYLKTSTGKKWGALLGAVTAPIAAMMQDIKIEGVSKDKAKSMMKSPLMFASLAAAGAISGLCSGSIIDYFSNKNAAAHADKTAAIDKKA